jgi:hypothetical protein
MISDEIIYLYEYLLHENYILLNKKYINYYINLKSVYQIIKL